MSTWAVMLHYQREQIAARCLEALLASAPEPPRVLLVDACSPDGSGERLRARFPRVDYLGLRENLGYAGGNNAGIAYALERGATKVLVLNDDAEVFPDTIAQLEAALDADPQASLAAPTIYFERPGGPIFWAGGEFDVKRALGTPQPTAAPSHVTRHPSPVSFVSGCCLLIRKESLERSQAFAADYWSYGEDVELSLRHRRDGWRLLWVPTAQAVHHTAYPEPEAPAWKIRLRDRNRRRMVRAHYGAGDRLRFALWFYPTRVLRALEYVARGDWARLRALWQGATER